MSKKGFITAIPYLALLLGILIFSYGTFASFDSHQNKEFFSGLGKTILASGIFALLLKTIQFLGVFKDELTKVIYEPKFLSNRKDLPEIWADISKVMFKNKFPSISKKLLKDVTETYFPTNHSIYYDDLEQFITIKYFDESKGVIELTYETNLNIVCSNINEKCLFKYANALILKKSDDDKLITMSTLKVDDKLAIPTHYKTIEGKKIVNSYEIELTGKEKYKIERKDVRRYEIESDNMMYFNAIKITNGLKVTIQHPENINIDFKKCGTISEFEVKRNTTNFKEFRYQGIVYPHQGYIFTINKN